MAARSTPLLGTVSKAAQTLWPYIRNAADQGIGLNEMIRTFQLAGIATARRTDMAMLLRAANNAVLIRSDILRWPKNLAFPLQRVRLAEEPIVGPVSYLLRINAGIDENGKPLYLYRRAHSEEVETASDILGSFRERLENEDRYAGIDFGSAEIVDIVQSGEAGVI